jgi:hypothetical protein
MKPARKEPVIKFTPVPLRARQDGWTAERQIAFIEALAETACIEEACRRVGMSDSAAYTLRHRPSAAAFRKAWDAALHYAAYRLDHAAFSRSLNGVPRPVFYKGEQVGEWRHFDERLTMFLLRHRRKHWYGKGTDQPLPDDQDNDRESDPAIRLDGGIERIAWEAEDDGEADEDRDAHNDRGSDDDDSQ